MTADDYWHLHPDSDKPYPEWHLRLKHGWFVGVVDGRKMRHVIKPGRVLYKPDFTFGLALCNYRMAVRLVMRDEGPLEAWPDGKQPNVDCERCYSVRFAIGSGVVTDMQEATWKRYFGQD